MNINKLYKAIKLSHEGNKLYAGRDLKLNQLQDYKKQMDAVLKKISKKQTINLVESCAGNCFVSFYLAWHYREEYPKTIKFTCIERNERLMEEAKETAKELGLENMRFIASNVEDVEFEEAVHVVYSLHACDMATDYTLYLGAKSNARYVLSVSCCQHTMHKRIKGHPLTSMTRHGVYKDLVAAMIGDTMRAELMTEKGYKTDIFAFTSVKNTGKNVMLRACLTPTSHKKKQEATEKYEALKLLFKAEPELGKLLNDEENSNLLPLFVENPLKRRSAS